ncbi:PAS modulated sigma54 specific transcriptional regulator, Fis family [Candidatus Desulfarcum epimagneticum]|uniref:PAS modulated sigma54 specific transcriptional regulator, Fis family n=1 Tax=uncultured Desulfobacteraceae bacterium TaxID=218296 RepID=A0A484HMZ9_9BACT|nr:PAS modulated sigma54 specific transcriptional regulator, Fis family [uncultured Desulfobacteraceae bacterium]
MKKLSENINEIILESISDGVFTVNHHWEITMFNRSAEEITGIPRGEALGKKCWDVFRSNMCESDCALKKTMREGRPFVSDSTYIVNSEKKRIPVTACASLLKDETGKVVGGVEIFRDHTLVEELRKELTTRFRMGDMVSKSPAMQRMFENLPRIAESESATLIEGETGVGKELAARAIHNLSLRKDNPFVPVNCGALPDSLLESELFGYKKGAFTHAVKDKPGIFQAAADGTIFLDEIGETSPAFQVRLLRALESREFRPLGAVEKVKADFRIIAATHRNLGEMIQSGEFRADLFYRINVVALDIPPLRERMEDIPMLIDHFVEKLNRIRGKHLAGVDEKALEMLMSHDFPGNIRELENIIEHGFALCREGRIGLRHLPAALSGAPPKTNGHEPSGDLVKAAEVKVIMDAMRKNRYNRAAAARDMGIHKSTLFRKIKRLGLDLPKAPPSSG